MPAVRKRSRSRAARHRHPSAQAGWPRSAAVPRLSPPLQAAKKESPGQSCCAPGFLRAPPELADTPSLEEPGSAQEGHSSLKGWLACRPSCLAVRTPRMAYDEALAEEIRAAIGARRGWPRRRNLAGAGLSCTGTWRWRAGAAGFWCARRGAELACEDAVEPMVMQGRPMAGWLHVTGPATQRPRTTSPAGWPSGSPLPASCRPRAEGRLPSADAAVVDAAVLGRIAVACADAVRRLRAPAGLAAPGLKALADGDASDDQAGDRVGP